MFLDGLREFSYNLFGKPEYKQTWCLEDFKSMTDNASPTNFDFTCLNGRATSKKNWWQILHSNTPYVYFCLVVIYKHYPTSHL